MPNAPHRKSTRAPKAGCKVARKAAWKRQRNLWGKLMTTTSATRTSARECRRDGILPAHAIRWLMENGHLLAEEPIAPDQYQPASLDLRLGRKAWRVRASFLPGRQRTVAERLEELALHEMPLEGGAVLETGCVYIVPLMESLRLPEEVAAAANPKSSTGRIDVFTRVITESGTAFDRVPCGYEGPLFAEISPRTFPILVRPGSRLSQIRFRRGRVRLSDEATRALHERDPLVVGTEADIDGGVALSVDLCGGDITQPIGYRARRHAGLIDVDAVGRYDLETFWEPIGRREPLILDPGEFYILASKEAVRIPPATRRKWCPSIPSLANSGCITRVSSIRGSVTPVEAARGRGRCWRCAPTRCPSRWRTARSSGGCFTSPCANHRNRSTGGRSGPITSGRG